MDITLTAIEGRILGSLIEKQLTTPEYYPLTINSLKSACNQKSNREPVMGLDEKTLIRGLDGLRKKNLVFEKAVPGGRVYKYEHRLTEQLPFSDAEVAVLCVLLLRGPQTVGEIKGRTSRLYEFESLDEVEDSLAGLMTHEYGSFVAELPLQPGRREHRYCQHLTDDVDDDMMTTSTPEEPISTDDPQGKSRIGELEDKVEALEQKLDELSASFAAFKSEFE